MDRKKGIYRKNNVLYVIQKIVNHLAEEAGNLLLIAGDIASDFNIFKLFVQALSKALRKSTVVVFTLGNHELWSFPNMSIEEIVSAYQAFLNEHGMYLLHNDILYKEDPDAFSALTTKFHQIKYSELIQMSDAQIFDRLRKARFVILGGLGFSGYNLEFNANSGIYRNTIDRMQETEESHRFEGLYNRLRLILAKKNAIILTHTPKSDWCHDATPDRNFVYVSGHTHRNVFHDDGEYRIYSDNQIGYHSNAPHLKSFLLDSDYDCFSDYCDGIYEITGEQYADFYRGKNIPMTFHREVNKLYMLKKKLYYCFIHVSKNGRLSILNGGAVKNLAEQDIQYYYDNMETMICAIKPPLDKFTIFQNQAADVVKKIGGWGRIHGCIIDIDGLTHLYANPFDFSITGYWASNIIHKVVYSSIPALLEEKCPEIYRNYVSLIEEGGEELSALKQSVPSVPSSQIYIDTDIYKASREVKKLQKLDSSILSVWNENAIFSGLKQNLHESALSAHNFGKN